MFKKICLFFLGTLVVLVGGFAIVVALQPASFAIERSATIHATPAEVFPHVNDFHKWEAWSPWAKLDPNAKNTFEGTIGSPGAVFKWSGNKEVGVGSMTLLESVPNERVKLKLHFLEPQEGISITEFNFKADGDKTVVRWTMNGENGFVAKAFCLFMDMDKMVGGSFEEGLTNIKGIVEQKKESK